MNGSFADSARVREVRRNVITTYAARATGLVVLLAGLPLIIGAFGGHAAGAYLLVSAVVGLLQTDLGLASGSVSFMVAARNGGSHEEVRRVVSTSHLFFGVLGAFCGLTYLGVFAVGWTRFTIPSELREATATLVVLGAVQLACTFAATSVRQVLTAYDRLDVTNYIVIGQGVLRLAGYAAIWSHPVSIVAVGVVDTVAALGALSASLVARRAVVPGASFRVRAVSMLLARRMLRVNLALVVLSLAALVVMQTGSIIVSLSLPLVAVTAYSAGFRIYQLCKEITNSLGSALLPFAARLQVEGHRSSLKDVYYSITAYSGALQLAIILPLVFLAEPITHMWLDSSVSLDAAAVAVILLLSLVAGNNHLIAVPLMTANGTIARFAGLHALWAGAAVAGGLVFTRTWGVAGMAIAFTVPVVLLEPIYITRALRALDGRWRDYAAAVLIPMLLPATLATAWLFLAKILVAAPSRSQTLGIFSVSVIIFGAIYLLVSIDAKGRGQLLRAFGQRARNRVSQSDGGTV